MNVKNLDVYKGMKQRNEEQRICSTFAQILKPPSHLFLFSFLFLFMFAFHQGDAYAGQVSLSWAPPVTNTDGTPLTDLAGYRVYYGTSSGNYSQNINVGNVTTYTVSNLADGSYFFTVAAYDTSGNQSAYSNQVNKTVQTESELTINKIDSGLGTVTSSSSGINCGTVCSGVYTNGTLVTLTAKPSNGATFAGWSGGVCTGIGTICSFTLKSNAAITATFTASTSSSLSVALYAPSGVIISTGQTSPGFFSSLQSAYNTAASSDTIETQAAALTENLVFNSPMSVVIQGGYDSSFTSIIGYTIIRGTLTIQDGTVIIGNIVLN